LLKLLIINSITMHTGTFQGNQCNTNCVDYQILIDWVSDIVEVDNIMTRQH